jgi:predicted flap endonuclease-1-like 5' DNA nuclease
MVYKIEQVEGIGRAYGERLRAVGIATTAQLLRACSDAKGRRDTAARAGIDEALILKWANRADLMRVKGIGAQYSDLLEAAGVDTIKELRTRSAANLAARLAEVNGGSRLTRAVPAEKMVAGWIQQAKQLPAVLTY